MIENSNESTYGDWLQDEELVKEYSGNLSGPISINDVLQNLQSRRENVLNGGTNCIPLPFERFRQDIPGVEQSQYIVISANQKTGKSMFASFVYLYSVLDYAFENPSKCSAHIIYFSLEESIEKVIERYMSHLLFKLDGIRITPADLRSTSSDYPVDQKILDKLNSEKYQERLRFFKKCVQFETENTNPTGILRVCESYAKSVGNYVSHKHKSNGLSGREVEVFDSYTPYDKNHYKIVIIDHIGLVDKEQGFKTKDAVDKMSEYCVKYLRNRYGFTCVVIQQQASESEGLEAIKSKRMVPTAATLADSRYTARDADLVIGLFDPSKFGQAQWLGYKIQDPNGVGLRNYGRFLYVIANRNGEMGGICPLFFDGAVCNYEELPKISDFAKLQDYYAKAKNLHEKKRPVLSLLLFIKKLFTNGR